MPSERPFYKKKRFLIPVILLLSVIGLILWYDIDTQVNLPLVDKPLAVYDSVREPNPGFYTCNSSWLQHSTSGLWEMYVTGSPFECGVANGKLSRRLIYEQEDAFVSRIREMIPSDSYLKFLKYFIYWFNRDLDEYVPDEYLQEIYGVSLSASSQYDFIGSGYHRMLNYHSAHDIGHALQDLAMVGCTSFGAWGNSTSDGSLIIGRNFDFYMGEKFAKNKIVCFEKPEKGYPFMMVTWAGMIGSVSGMNLAGLTVTINAAKSEIPMSARTPISILAREILQYAGNIQEAFDIAKKRQTFVSESLLIGSARDQCAAIIEKSPATTALVMSRENHIICTNHFQSDEFRDDPLNRKNIRESASMYRFRRMEQLISKKKPIDVIKAAAILRDQKGWDDRSIGMGNEKAVNQLIAHHSIIFMPGKRLVWVSQGPWQSGSYICYDLNEIFNTFGALKQRTVIEKAGLNIAADSFLGTTDYIKFLQYKIMRDSLQQLMKDYNVGVLNSSFFDEFTEINPDYYEGYALAGDWFMMNKKPGTALDYYRLALKREIPVLAEREKIIRNMSKCIIEIKEPIR